MRVPVSIFFAIPMCCLASCRCTDTTAGQDDGGATLGQNQGKLQGSGELVVHGPSETKAQPPPLRPGEKRRAGGEPDHPNPTEPDPLDEPFTLEQATEGLEGDGQLVAIIDMSLARLRCRLYANKAPATVANFVGLARGKRPFWDPWEGLWVTRRFYDGLRIHKTIPGMYIRGGCPFGDGSGGPGYQHEGDEPSSLSHDGAGLISMVGEGPEKNGSQFVILDGPAPQLNGRYTVFGECTPAEAIFRVARVPQGEKNQPLTHVLVRSVRIVRDDS